MTPLYTDPCPACGESVAHPFFDGGAAPLVILGWPRTEEEARAMPPYRLDFVQCLACGHVWNRAFRYEDVPYGSQPSLMFNAGVLWNRHLAQLVDEVLTRLPENPTVVEIGCGCGHFLRSLAARRQGRYIGFDPHQPDDFPSEFQFEARLFDPVEDLLHLQPDLVVMRHVLEHFSQPAAFLQQLAWAAGCCKKTVRLLVEVPCIDRVFATGRLVDFYYEHPQQFSTESLRALLQRVGAIVSLWHTYDGEVVLAIVELQLPLAWRLRAEAAAKFEQGSQEARRKIAAQLQELANSGLRVALWGGTGKGAAFMHHFGVKTNWLTWVVDSDPNKVGTYVAGVGQQIVSPEELKTQTPDVVIIPTQWRAADIVAEMARLGIEPKQVLIEHQGQLVDYWHSAHPYALPKLEGR